MTKSVSVLILILMSLGTISVSSAGESLPTKLVCTVETTGIQNCSPDRYCTAPPPFHGPIPILGIAELQEGASLDGIRYLSAKVSQPYDGFLVEAEANVQTDANNMIRQNIVLTLTETANGRSISFASSGDTTASLGYRVTTGVGSGTASSARRLITCTID